MNLLNVLKRACICLFIIQLSGCRVNAQTDTSGHPSLNLMPVPAEVKMLPGKFRIKKDFALSVDSNAPVKLFKAADRFLRRLDGRTGLFFKQGFISKSGFKNMDEPSFFIATKKEARVKLYEDESYRLIVGPDKITLDAPTETGAIRGFETLLQLMATDDQGYYFPALEINDKPRFPWRGLMIDVARHFQPVDVLKRNIDAMAAYKMNVFHFHLSDNQGWRVESKTYPKLHQLASDGLYYSHEQIKDIVNYAADRGIRVMPEFDVPGHATAMLVAYPELGSAPGPYAIERSTGIFDPVLNPTLEQTYTFLDKLFTEMSNLFPDEYFHIGGDENNGRHWKTNPEIQAFMKKNNIKTVLELQTYFNNKLIKTIKKLNKKMVGWEEIFQADLSKDAIIHSWLGKESIYKAASQGYATILSNGYYIDLMYSAADHYLNDPLPPVSERTEKERKYVLTPEQEKLILGGEATMWTELVTPFTIDSRIWPRTGAIAERLWSPGSVKDVKDMYRRLDCTSFRLEELGVTHLKNKDAILRNLANGGDITPLKVLVDVIEPYKGYTRNNFEKIYKIYSPFFLMADAASADAPSARLFSNLLNDYEKNPAKENREALLVWLNLWKNNHAEFMKISAKSSNLKQMESLSKKLSDLATIALSTLDKGNFDAAWYQEKTLMVQAVKEESIATSGSGKTVDGRTELALVEPVQKMLDLANPSAAKARMEIEEKARLDREAKAKKVVVPTGH